MYELVKCHLCDGGIFFAETQNGDLVPGDTSGGDHRNKCNNDTRRCGFGGVSAGQCW